MSETVLENRNENTENIDQKALELAQDFSYDGFAGSQKGTFCSFARTGSCDQEGQCNLQYSLHRWIRGCVYIQILVNPEDKRMVVRKCEENDKDALRWCIAKPDKRKSRKMSNKIFFSNAV